MIYKIGVVLCLAVCVRAAETYIGGAGAGAALLAIVALVAAFACGARSER